MWRFCYIIDHNYKHKHKRNQSQRDWRCIALHELNRASGSILHRNPWEYIHFYTMSLHIFFVHSHEVPGVLLKKEKKEKSKCMTSLLIDIYIFLNLKSLEQDVYFRGKLEKITWEQENKGKETSEWNARSHLQNEIQEFLYWCNLLV